MLDVNNLSNGHGAGTSEGAVMVPPDAAVASSAGERLVAAAREDAAAAARELIGAAVAAADEVCAKARRDAEDMITLARAQIERERVLAEGRAAERIDAAEHEALQIWRSAWAMAGAEIARQGIGDVLSADGSAERNGHRCHEREHLALAMSAIQQACRILDSVAGVASSGSANLALTAATLQSMLHPADEPGS